jgi:predicted nucleic-acid-binding protein
VTGLDTNVLMRYIMQVLAAQRRFKSGGVDFADSLIERIAHEARCTVTMTFDAAAARSAGMTLVS